ncbi:MAG: hypothetical protein MUE75_16905 [Algoriphagus sp.]|nr:hypothetical protein [Algoriphagus sp.]
MALFQNSVLKKYLAAQAHQPMHEAFAAYLTYFHNPRIRLNILAAKEEQFQEGFLRELFVKIFGLRYGPNALLDDDFLSICSCMVDRQFWLLKTRHTGHYLSIRCCPSPISY